MRSNTTHANPTELSLVDRPMCDCVIVRVCATRRALHYVVADGGCSDAIMHQLSLPSTDRR